MPESAGGGVDLVSVALILATAVLWGATDASMKYFSPPTVRQSNKG